MDYSKPWIFEEIGKGREEAYFLQLQRVAREIADAHTESARTIAASPPLAHKAT